MSVASRLARSTIRWIALNKNAMDVYPFLRVKSHTARGTPPISAI